MLYKAVDWFWRRYRPAEGWLSFFLLFAAIACLTTAITAAEWVPEDGIVPMAGALGLLLGVVVAKGPLRPLAAWLLILNYGLVATLVQLGDLLPPLPALVQGEGALVFRRQWLLLFDRLAGWWLAVSQGGSSSETLVFAFALGLLAWLLAAYAAWSTYRRRRPLVALTLLGLVLALNGYFSGGQAPAWLTALFTGLAVMLAAAMHYANMEHVWLKQGVDYSREIRVELLAVAAAVATILLALSLLLPAFRISTLARAFQQSAPVQQAEDTMERAFAGVRRPRPRTEDVAAAAGGGVMPRAYLLGNAPELYETVVLTATVQPSGVQGADYWRGFSYDVYTGRGWALSDERSVTLDANDPLLPLQGGRVLTQTVVRHAADPQVRYTLGFPHRFDDPVTAYWHGADDFSRVSGPGPSYRAASTLPAFTPHALRQSGAAPDIILARYASLPDNVPARVAELAREVTAARDNDYDRARALETFLRQYPYSLEVDPPPPGRDPVDFFLFDLQSGYCDYYASAMTVMARSVGIPVRLVVGYRAQAPDERSVQTIYQINAHAWVEVYFEAVGWVVFEPTAAFPARGEVVEGDPLAIDNVTPEPPPLSLPASDSQRRFAPWLALLLMVLLPAAWFWWLRRARTAVTGDPILWAYRRVQHSARRLGQDTPPSQTPAEFQNAFAQRLAPWESHAQLGRLLAGIRPTLERLTWLFIKRQYGRPDAARRRAAGSRVEWQSVLRRLWLFRYLKRFFRRSG